MVYGHRPKDWAPLTGDDPCPGDPEAWAPVVGHYEQRVEDLRRLRRDHLLPHTSIDAEGNRFRKLEQAFSDGAQMLEMAAEEFSNAAETVKSWQNSLRQLQAEADEALRKARAQQFLIEGYEQKIAALDREADSDPEWDPIIWGQIRALKAAVGGAQLVIASQQSVVDGVRRQHEMIAASVRDQYHIRSVGDMYLHRKKSNRLSDSYKVFTTLIADDKSIDFDALALNRLSVHAADSPEDLEKFLEALKELTPGQLAAYLATRQADLALYPLQVSDDIVDNALVVKSWWDKLPQEKRNILMNTASGMIGNLEGVDYESRDEANRKLLDNVLADPNLKDSVREKLEHIRKVLDNPKAGTDLYLTSLDLSNLQPLNEDNYDYNDVLASVSLGSIDEADKVSVVVPGMDNKATSMEDLAMAGTNIYNEQENALKEHGDGDQKLAVEIWIGYETPPDLGQQPAHPDKWVTRKHLAEEGGKKLAAHLDGMNVTKSQYSADSKVCLEHGDYSDPSISVIAHSYGTTTMGQAAQHAETNVDSIVMYGSAGIGYNATFDANGDGWNVDRDSEGRQKIYYTGSGEDWTAGLGRTFGLRLDPLVIGDAESFQSTEGISADGQYYEDVDTHDFISHDEEQGYVDEKTTSLYYGARAAAGYEEDLDKKFYEPWYIEYDPRTDRSFMIRITQDDLDENGLVPEHLMEKVRKSQGYISDSDLVDGDSGD